MSAHDSKYPDEPKHKSIRVDNTGISMNWRNVILGVLTVLGTAGGYTGLRFVTCNEMDTAIKESEEKQGVALEGVRTTVEMQGEQLGGLTITVGQIERVQHQDIAHREARRVVEKAISCRPNQHRCVKRRERETERIRRINMKRLAIPKKNGGPLTPCATIDCQ